MKKLFLFLTFICAAITLNAQTTDIVSEINKMFSEVDFFLSTSYKISSLSYNEDSNIVSIKADSKNSYGKLESEFYVSYNLSEIKKPEIIDANNGKKVFYITSADEDCIYTKIVDLDIGYIKTYGSKEYKTVRNELKINSQSESMDKKLCNLLAQLYELTNNTLNNFTPLLSIKDAQLIDVNGNKMLELNETVNLILTIKNEGNYKSENVKVKLLNINEVKGLVYDKEILIPSIESGSSKKIDIPIKTNSLIESSNVVFKVSLKDNQTDYKNDLKIELPVKILGNATISFGNLPYTDIDIPKTTNQRNNTYALIIGNEDYKSKQPNLSNESNVKFAVNDAKVLREYFNKTLGIPNVNITLITDATTAQMQQGINKFKLIPQVNPNAEIIFYYAGHGLPDQNTKEQYIIPVDVSGSNIKYGLKINDIISELNLNNPKKLLIVLDACFSGAGRDEGLLSNRGVKIVPKKNIVKNNTIVFSSSSSSEASKAYEEMQHGMFTYFLLKKLKETKGDVTLKDLYDYTYLQVREKSLLINNQIQTPTIVKSPVFTKTLDDVKF